MQSILISMGILVGGKIVSSIDYVSLESRRYGESIRAIYNSNSVDYDEGAHIVASGDAHNGSIRIRHFMMVCVSVIFSMGTLVRDGKFLIASLNLMEHAEA